MNSRDLQIVRDLAGRVAEIAASGENQARRAEWYRHNALQAGKALIFCSPEGSWLEINEQPELAPQCEDETARGYEAALRARLYQWEHFADDEVMENRWSVGHALVQTGYGLEPVYHRTEDTERGSCVWDAPIKEPSDLAKLTVPTTTVDWDASRERLAESQEVFGDILDVQLRSFHWWTLAPGYSLAQLRGLEQFMLDMVERPEWVHEAMAWFRDAKLEWLASLQAQGLLTLNNTNDYVGSGGFGFTEELPGAGFDPAHVRTQDMWGFFENQETTAISPRMFKTFMLDYQLPIMELFGLNCFGCCEPLHDRFEYVLQIPRLRRISISPWCDREISARALQNKYLFSWKPNPARLASEVMNEEVVRRDIRETLEIARGCVVEIILKDTHTCRHEPQRFDRWCRIAREEVERAS
ncbi:MAG TPA: hypothetical protein VGM19_00900 [Armatimonadota bacterium]|jgi:hypothetical protein